MQVSQNIDLEKQSTTGQHSVMKGDGFYDLHSEVQLAVIAQVSPLIEAAAVSVPLPERGRPFTLVDYGCSEGRNSVLALRVAMEAVRRASPFQPFSVVHNDLPTNNFNKLFGTIYHDGTVRFPVEYAASSEAPVFVFASGQSFYTQIMPENSVHFAFSSSATHWTTRPPKIKAHIYQQGATESEAKQFASIARFDWMGFVANRMCELVKGGRMVVTAAARIPETDARPEAVTASGGRETHSAQIVFELMHAVLESFVAEGKVQRAALDAFAFPIYCRDSSEFLAPVSSGGVAVEHFSISPIQCPMHKKYKENGNAEEYAQELTDLIRAFTETVLLRGLFKVTERRKLELERSPEQQTVNEIYDRMRKEIIAAPDKYTFYPIQATIVLAKR